MILPRFGDHHQHSLLKGIASQMQKLQAFVKAGSVGELGRADREDALYVAREMRRLHKRFAGAHPVLVALDGVDLAVVGDKAIRMRQRPARESVGGKTAMQKHERALQTLVLKVGVEIHELRSDEHPLVNECARRKAGEIHPVVSGRTRPHSPFGIS